MSNLRPKSKSKYRLALMLAASGAIVIVMLAGLCAVGYWKLFGSWDVTNDPRYTGGFTKDTDYELRADVYLYYDADNNLGWLKSTKDEGSDIKGEVPAKTRLRFVKATYIANFEIGDSVQVFMQIIDGRFAGTVVDVTSISKENYGPPWTTIDPKFIVAVNQP